MIADPLGPRMEIPQEKCWPHREDMIDLSHKPFFIFGCGSRPKLVCTARGLFHWPSNEAVIRFSARRFIADGAAYTVEIETVDGSHVIVSEDEQGVWLARTGRRDCLAESDVTLPSFANHSQRDLLRALHHEILVNIVDGRPLPNLLVYDKPWYRDGAMVAMVLEKTGNVGLIRDWIMSLRDPFDRNNDGHEEPDNLGQVLYMLSLVSDSCHPIVKTVMDTAKQFSSDEHLTGLTDFREHPVYQTKWLKFGLGQLGLTDDYTVPKTEDSYAPLFWWDKEDVALSPDVRYHNHAERYPYLAWAEAHFWGDEPPVQFIASGYPLTWEAHASEADYLNMQMVDEAFVERKLSMPHTWHGAEMFLYLHEESQPRVAPHRRPRAGK